MKQSHKHFLRQYANDLSGLYGIKDMTFNDGRAKGVRAIEMNNGNGLLMTVLPDRCLDIPYLSYKNINIGLINKTGISSPAYYNEEGARGFLKQFNGGLLTTCGIAYAGAPDEINGRQYGLHGRIGNMPAENVNVGEVINNNDDISLRVSGEVREACVFEENLVLKREIVMETEANTIHIHDVVENRGFDPQPIMNLYHINFGYPMLQPESRIYFSTREVAPRDDIARQGIAEYHMIDAPVVGYQEQCFVHTGGDGDVFAMLHNPKSGLAVVIHVDIKQLPIFNQWKCMRAGDYALGLEPSAAGFMGRVFAQEKGWLKHIEGGGSRAFDIRIDILDNADDINALASLCKENEK